MVAIAVNLATSSVRVCTGEVIHWAFTVVIEGKVIYLYMQVMQIKNIQVQ